ncbi:hypothetical protein [Microtetraspora malaysiensis]|uniref:hypothetical protein n=1 Tax=Microtetraspora malaysiensis TaxID=161358 RepID=UPI000837A28F|nr:hypothetical protein [Microtetraspora malaysiensis]
MRSRLTAALLLLLPVFLLAGATPTDALTATHRAASVAALHAGPPDTARKWHDLPTPGVEQQHRVPRLQARTGPCVVSGGVAVLPSAGPYRALLVMGKHGTAGPGLPVPPGTSIAPARAPPSTAQ